MSRRTDRPDHDVEERDRLWRALAGLPFRQRAALVLRYYEDLSERDAARALGTTVAGIKALVSRGTTTLRATLGREA
jgi:RNA polymerase sigma factor (sigma-70 family)